MKKNNKVLLYILIVIILLLIGYLTYNYITNYNNKKDNTIKTTDIDESSANYNVALYNNYTYILPRNVFYSVKTSSNNTAFHIYNNVDKWGALIKLVDKTKSNLLFDDYDELEKQLKSNNSYDVKNRSVMENESDRVVSFEIYGSTANILLAYMPAYDNYEYEISLYDGDDKSMNYTALYTVLSILKTGVATKE